ncbi:GGDEF domain-containing protein [Deinococcus roseus]|uniref:GGDEF domain-containing protein n=1 Tax=Deinococcus roseus TaxID=392414 RepID=A0ABQ2CXM1_9DEIO|nr:GGDEF domain-containing protein [Deinococcus roseus]GGJ26730.1 hypothetical protein GCM10008938_11060 [Deinococcus roseus]
MGIDGIFNANAELVWGSERLKNLFSGKHPWNPEQPVRVHSETAEHLAFHQGENLLLVVPAHTLPLESTLLHGIVLLEPENSLQALHAAAYTDPLTQLGNRRAFEETLKQHTQSTDPLALVILDLDGLKTINDQHGHLQGDAFLKFVAQQLQAQLRPSDRAFRIGGDEFALLLHGLKAAQVHVVYEHMQAIRQQLKSSAFPEGDVSAGVAFHPLESMGDSRILLRLADERMYEHKRSKGNPGQGSLVGSINRQAVIRGMEATLEVLLSREVPTAHYWQLMLDFAVQMVPSAQAGSLDLWNGRAFVKVAQLGFDDQILGLELTPEAQLIWYGQKELYWRKGIPRILRDVPVISTTSFFSAEISGDPERIGVFEGSGRLGDIQCTLNAPITHQGKIYGHLNLDNFVSHLAFNQDSVQVTLDLIRQCATVCHNLNLPAYLP